MGGISQLNLPLAWHTTEPHRGVIHSGYQQRNFYSLYMYICVFEINLSDIYYYFIQWGFQFSLVWLMSALPVDFLMLLRIPQHFLRISHTPDPKNV